MKVRIILAIVFCLGLLALVVGLSQAQQPQQPTLLAEEQEVETEEGVQPMATATAEWRQRLGQDGQDNFRVQRRPSSSGSSVTLLTLSNVGDLTLKGSKLGLGGSTSTRLQRSGSQVLDLYVSNQRALRLLWDGATRWVEVGGNLTVTGQFNGGTAWTSANDGAGSGLDADLLDGQEGSFYQDASNINAGTLDSGHFSAYDDLGAEGYLDNDADTDLLTRAQADGRYWKLAGNAGTAPGTDFLGTTDNQALELKVNNVRALRIEPNATSPNLIGGYSGNTVTSGAYGTAIGGGGESGSTNRVTDHYGTVDGGKNNQAGDGDGNVSNRTCATVGGGQSNSASGSYATIGGGSGNSAIGSGATVGGGELGWVTGTDATVGGGYSNAAEGAYATVGGGWDNTANAMYATVPGGRAAQASYYGQMAYASGKFSSSGDAQTSIYVLRNTTSDAAETELFLDGTDDRLIVFSDRTLTFHILVVARSSGGASAGYHIYGVIENVDGNTTSIGTPTVTTLGEDVAGWAVAVEANDTYDALIIKVTGALDTSIRWVATVRTVEVAY